MTVEQKLLQFIDDRAEEVLQFTKELIATPSETPPGDERQIAKVILDKLERIGLNGAVVASEVPERPNVLYRLQGSNEGPTLLYVAHTDTKPVGDARNQ
jgi:acetylornithine deacetylase/succinyl-diaminopimelate desuccinylase-like protein